jgi:hypothetical protein
VGRFVLLLAEQGFPILPVGVYEENGEFCLHFGPSFRLQVPHGPGTEGRDRTATQTIMAALADLLPLPLRGVFGEKDTG